MIILICGVAGTGKTTIGKMLSERTGWPFIDADDYHSDDAKKKMTVGIPLADKDRLPWLRKLNDILAGYSREKKSVILACSALTNKYRSILLHDVQDVLVVWLNGDFDMIKQRIESRQGHFFSAELLKSQFDIAEKPTGSLVCDVGSLPEDIVEDILGVCA